MIRRTILAVILSLFVAASLNAKLVLIAPSSVSSSNNFYLKVDFRSDSGEAEDLYVLFSLYGQLYSFTGDGNIVSGIKKYATTAEIEKTIFVYPFSSVSFDTTIPFIAASLTKDSPANAENIREMTKKEVLFRKSFERNIDYLENYLNNLKNDKYGDYTNAVYVSRTLLVRHPELYLRVDDIFFQEYLQEHSFPNIFDNNFASVKPAEILQDDIDSWNSWRAPYLELFDRRVLPPYFYLKAGYSYGDYNYLEIKKNFTLTNDEKAFLLYFYKKYYVGYDNIFVILSLNGNAYVYADGRFFDTQGNEISAEKIDKPIFLVMNEKYVWYPTMGRDDTGESVELKDVVEMIDGDKNDSNVYAFLSVFEQEWIDFWENEGNEQTDKIEEYVKMLDNESVVEQIRTNYYICSSEEFCSKISSLSNFIDSLMGKRAFGDKRAESMTYHLRIFADTISPFADYIYRIFSKKDGDKEDKYNEISKKMREFIPYSTTYWGGFGSYDDQPYAYTIDVGYRAGAGVCNDIASYTAGILQVIGENWIQMSFLGLMPENESISHAYIYLPNQNWYFDNGLFFTNITQRYVSVDGKNEEGWGTPITADNLNYYYSLDFYTYDEYFSPFFNPFTTTTYEYIYKNGQYETIEHTSYDGIIWSPGAFTDKLDRSKSNEQQDLSDFETVKHIVDDIYSSNPNARVKVNTEGQIEYLNRDQIIEAIERTESNVLKYVFYIY